MQNAFYTWTVVLSHQFAVDNLGVLVLFFKCCSHKLDRWDVNCHPVRCTAVQSSCFAVVKTGFCWLFQETIISTRLYLCIYKWQHDLTAHCNTYAAWACLIQIRLLDTLWCCIVCCPSFKRAMMLLKRTCTVWGGSCIIHVTLEWQNTAELIWTMGYRF